jgi:MFS family permease
MNYAEPTAAKPRMTQRPARHQNGRYAWFVTMVLLVAYTFAFIDRQVMNLLVEPVRHAFRLDDTHVSLLLGVAFVVAYAIGAPFGGRLADASNRRNVCLIVVGLWSLFTIGCGFAPNYEWLFGARFAVGATEACLMPAAWSLIADYFSRDRLPRAMSLFLLGPYLGGGIALILGGAVVESVGTTGASGGGPEGWRVAFMVAGAIGLIPAILLSFVREPHRGDSDQAQESAPPIAKVARYLLGHWRFYGGFYFGVSLQTITFYAFPAWMPTYLVRHFKVPLGKVGLHYGAVTLAVGCLGVLCSPYIARWLSRNGLRDSNMRMAAWSSTLIAPIAALVPFVPSYWLALLLVGIVTFIGSLPMPTNAAALQMVTPPRMRGIAASIYMFTVSLVGVAIPPTMIALLTDHVFHDSGAVGQSLAIVCVGASICAALVLWVTLKGYRDARAVADEAAA